MTECNPILDADITVTLGWEGGQFLALSGDCQEPSGLWWNQLVMPEWDYRYTYAPPSAFVPGNVLLSAVPDAGAVAMQVAVRDTSVNGVEVLKEQLRAALATWGGTLTLAAAEGEGSVIIGGPWGRFPTIPRWGRVTPQRVGLYIAEAVFSVPVNPTGAP